MADRPPKPRRRYLRRALQALVVLVLAHLLLILPWRWVDPPTSRFIERAEAQGFGVNRQWVELEAISPWAALAVVAAEDQRFPQHWGLDFNAISDALSANSNRDGRPRGASTLSQQLVKNLVLWPEASYARKAVEAWLVLWVEALWPKHRILELYLNLAEFGPGLFGIEAAARHYYGIPADSLNRPQAARLAAVLPNPKHRSPLARHGYVPRRAEWILGQMRQLGGLHYLQPIWPALAP